MTASLRFTFAAILATVAWAALGLQLGLAIAGAVNARKAVLPEIVAYLSSFTILTNAFCALVLSVRAVKPKGAGQFSFFRRDGTTTCALAAILLIGMIHHFVLRAPWDARGLQFVADIALHYVVPIAFLFYWIDVVPRGALAQRDILGWLRYPAAYTVYVFGRGVLVGEYPYFFIDASQLGWFLSLRNAGLALVAYVAVASILVVANRFAGLIRPLES